MVTKRTKSSITYFAHRQFRFFRLCPSMSFWNFSKTFCAFGAARPSQRRSMQVSLNTIPPTRARGEFISSTDLYFICLRSGGGWCVFCKSLPCLGAVCAAPCRPFPVRSFSCLLSKYNPTFEKVRHQRVSKNPFLCSSLWLSLSFPLLSCPLLSFGVLFVFVCCCVCVSSFHFFPFLCSLLSPGSPFPCLCFLLCLLLACQPPESQNARIRIAKGSGCQKCETFKYSEA